MDIAHTIPSQTPTPTTPWCPNHLQKNIHGAFLFSIVPGGGTFSRFGGQNKGDFVGRNAIS